MGKVTKHVRRAARRATISERDRTIREFILMVYNIDFCGRVKFAWAIVRRKRI